MELGKRRGTIGEFLQDNLMDNAIKRIEEIKLRFGKNTKNYLHPKDGSWKYWRYRVLRPLLKVKYKFYRCKKDPTPWLSPTSIEFFKEYLDGSQVGCEFGSGSSTVFFSKRVSKLVSIEHYRPWFDKVNAQLKANNNTVVDYRFVEQQEGDSTLSFEEQFPGIVKSDAYEYRKDYVNYFCALDDFEKNEYFDFIIVDGRARPECVFRSMPKLKKGGLMILDNSERSRYDIVFQNLDSWEMITTTNGLTDTTFWVKP